MCIPGGKGQWVGRKEVRECRGMQVWDGVFVGNNNKKAGKVCKCLCSACCWGASVILQQRLSDTHRAGCGCGSQDGGWSAATSVGHMMMPSCDL